MKLKGGSLRKKSIYNSSSNSKHKLPKSPSFSFSFFSFKNKQQEKENERARLISLAKQEKEKVKNFVLELNSRYKEGKLSYLEYENSLDRILKRKSPEYWLDYYDNYIKKLSKLVSQREIEFKFNLNHVFIILLIIFIGLSVFLFGPSLQKEITGFFVAQPGFEEKNYVDEIGFVTNISQDYEWIPEHQGQLLSLKLNGEIIDEGTIKIWLEDKLIYSNEQTSAPLTGSVVETLGMPEETGNETNITEENVTNVTIPEPIVKEPIENITNITEPKPQPEPPKLIPEPMPPEPAPQPEPQPIKEILLDNVCVETCDLSGLNLNKTSYIIKIEIDNATLEIHSLNYKILEAINVTIPTPPTNITNITELIQEQAEIGKPVRWKAKINASNINEARKRLPKIARVISSQEISTRFFEINYETPAPTIEEKTKGNRKIITVSGPDEVHYHNISASTTLPKEARQNQIKLYRTTDNFKEQVQITNFIDENNNGLIDKIEWIVPHLSNQTYELIIEIIKAEHLDNNRIFISDIYEQVKALDDIWSEEIPAEHYVRVTFEKNLTNKNDITIYPKTASGNPAIEVYEIGGTEKIAEFTNINSNQYNKIYLTNLISESQDTFDLKVISGSVEFDYIVDPVGTSNHWYVESGETTLAASKTTPVDLTQEVDISKSFILLTRRAGSSQDEPSDSGAYTEWVDNDTFNLIKYSTEAGAIYDWYVVEGKNINVQNGTQAYAANENSFDIPINQVDPNNTVVFMTFGSCDSTTPGDNNEIYWTGNVTSETTLHIQRDDGGVCDGAVAYFVVEFNDGSTIQRGEVSNVPADGASGYVSLNQEINCSNTWYYFSMAFNSAAQGLDDTGVVLIPYDANSFYLARKTAGGNARVQWYAISTPNAVVQNGTQRSTAATTYNVGINEVVLNRSFSTLSFNNSGGGTTFANLLASAQITTTTNLAITEQGGNTQTDCWQVVQLPRYSMGITWNAGEINLGSRLQENGNLTGIVNLTSIGPNNNINVSCSGENCSLISSDWLNGTDMTDGESLIVNFSCSNQTTGARSALFNAFSDEFPVGNEINVSCTITAQERVDWIQKTLDLGSVESGGNVSANNTVDPAGTNTNVKINAMEGNGSGFIEASPIDLGTLAGTGVEVNFTCSPVEQERGIYEMLFNVNSSEDPAGDNTIITCSVKNDLPVHGAPIIVSSSGGNTTNENLTCINQSTVDYDGDDIKNIYDWLLNSSSIYLTLSPFEGNSSDILTKEYSGVLGYDLTASATWNATGGYDGKGAYEFDGSSNYIYLDDSLDASAVFDATITERTVAMWYKADSVSGTTYRMLFEEGGTTNGMDLYIYESQIYAGAWSEGSSWNGNWSFTSTTADEWHFVALVFDGPNTNVSIYHDGEFLSVSNDGATVVDGHTGDDALGRTEDNTVAYPNEGSDLSATGDYFSGTIDEFMVFNRALSQEQLNALYEGKTNTTVNQETQVTENWSCNVFPNDGIGDGINLTSYEMTILEPSGENTAPVVEHVSEIPATSPVESNARDIKFSFTAYDEQGVADIDSSSIKVNLSVSQTHNVSHYNSSCVNAGNLDDYRINFSCAVDLWYWEPDTKWNVTINISDDPGLETTNKTTWFDYTTLTSIKIGPSSISFAGVNPGSSNITGSSSILVNNTGNDNTKIIAVNASNLWNSSVLGTQTSKYIAAENFTIDIETGASKPECDTGGNAFSLVNSTYVNLEGIYLLRGNNTNNEGQRNLYYCLVNVSSSLPSGDYDTTEQGPWWIKILAVLIVPASLLRLRKRKLEQEIEKLVKKWRKRYSTRKLLDMVEEYRKEHRIKEIKRIEIPISVFIFRRLAPMEALVKYLRENVGLRIGEIAGLLNKSHSSISITYKNSLKKKKSKLKIKTKEEKGLILNHSIFTEKRLSILESVIMHLKEQGMKNIEIAKLLERDQRNIASLINKINKKLKNK